VHLTFVDLIFAYISFSGLGKLVLKALLRRWCRCGAVGTGDIFEAYWSFLTGIHDTGEKCSDGRGLFFVQNCELRSKNKDASVRRH
jgi:hypothetical protein